GGIAQPGAAARVEEEAVERRARVLPRARAHAGVVPELTVEMRLLVIAAGQRQLRVRHARLQAAEAGLEAQHAAQLARAQANQFPERTLHCSRRGPMPTPARAACSPLPSAWQAAPVPPPWPGRA